jgi:5-deoxy-D-glucuronate isomerase
MLELKVANDIFHEYGEDDDGFEDSKDSLYITHQNTSTINETTKKKRKRKSKSKNNFPNQVNPF